MNKIIFAALFFIFLSCSKEPEATLITNFPDFTYQNSKNQENAYVFTSNKLILVFFDTSCKCNGKITYLDKHINDLPKLDMLLLTTDSTFFDHPLYYYWKSLRSADNINFGIVSSDIKSELFGVKAPLKALLYNENGLLVKNLGKEVNISLILRSLESN
ncbi:hypothetical protein KAJ27_10060 [bacterium]|nr:hypothetical protein [bacterium]